MIQENEVIMLLLGIAVLIFMQTNRVRLSRLSGWQTLFTSFHILIFTWVLTVLEGFIWREALNIVEHVCYAVSAILMAA